MDLFNVWAVDREGEGQRFKAHDKMTNRKLLWHGTNGEGIDFVSVGVRWGAALDHVDLGRWSPSDVVVPLICAKFVEMTVLCFSQRRKHQRIATSPLALPSTILR